MALLTIGLEERYQLHLRQPPEQIGASSPGLVTHIRCGFRWDRKSWKLGKCLLHVTACSIPDFAQISCVRDEGAVFLKYTLCIADTVGNRNAIATIIVINLNGSCQ